VQRRISSRGVTQVAGQTLRVGFAHRHTLVDIDVHKSELHVNDQAGERLLAIPRTNGKEVTRIKGYGVRNRVGSIAMDLSSRGQQAGARDCRATWVTELSQDTLDTPGLGRGDCRCTRRGAADC
jgi:hypothetical protein